MKQVFHIEVQSDAHLIEWHPKGALLAVASKGRTSIYERNGSLIDDITFDDDSNIVALKWNNDVLAIIGAGIGHVIFWEMSSLTISKFEIGFTDPSYFVWSPLTMHFAVGTKKGNVVICDKTDPIKNETLLGKHQGKIVCGMWLQTSDQIVLGSTDCSISVSSRDGTTISHFDSGEEPVEIIQENSSDGLILLIRLVTRFMVASFQSSGEPVVLDFNPDFGLIAHQQWSAKLQSTFLYFYCGKVIKKWRPWLNGDSKEEIIESGFRSMKNISTCPISQSVAFTEESGRVVLLDVNDDGSLSSELNNSMRSLENVTCTGFSPEGLLTISTVGHIYCFLRASQRFLYSSNGMTIAYLSSCRQLNTFNIKTLTLENQIELDFDPEVISLGQNHVSFGLNNTVYIYTLDSEFDESKKSNKVIELKYPVKNIIMNNRHFIAILNISGDITLYQYNEDEAGFHTSQVPFDQRKDSATCFAITEVLLIYGSDIGVLSILHIDSSRHIESCQLQHLSGIAQIFPNRLGTAIVFIDESKDGFVYQPNEAEMVPIPAFPRNVKTLFWDEEYRGVFYAFDGQNIHIFTHNPISIRGPTVFKHGDVELGEDGAFEIKPHPFSISCNLFPFMSVNGNLLCHSVEEERQIRTVFSPASERFDSDGTTSADAVRNFFRNVLLLRLNDAFKDAFEIKIDTYWKALANKSLEFFELLIARNVFQMLGDAGMVRILESLEWVEDKFFIMGRIYSLFNDYDSAQENYLASLNPYEALQMREDLNHLEAAISLSEDLFPQEMARLSLKSAEELESHRDFKESMNVLKKAVQFHERHVLHPTDKTLQKCKGGIARASIHLGDIENGIKIARHTNDVHIIGQCVDILQSIDNSEKARELLNVQEQIERANSNTKERS